MILVDYTLSLKNTTDATMASLRVLGKSRWRPRGLTDVKRTYVNIIFLPIKNNIFLPIKNNKRIEIVANAQSDGRSSNLLNFCISKIVFKMAARL